jgi:hypothetical protein
MQALVLIRLLVGILCIDFFVVLALAASEQNSGFAKSAIVETSPDAPFSISYEAGQVDANGKYLGGTELTAITAHNGKLYAANGYTADDPGADPSPGPQVLVLDSPESKWRELHAFSEAGRASAADALANRTPLLSSGSNSNLRFSRIGVIKSGKFTVDGRGLPLTEQEKLRASFLIVGLAGQNGNNGDAYSWNEIENQWIPAGIRLPSIRSIGFYRDPSTGVERVFAGGGSAKGRLRGGIYSGVYDLRSHSVAWDHIPEYDDFEYRVMGFFEYEGRFFFGARPSIYERINGPNPGWNSVYSYDAQQSQAIERWPGDSGFRGFGKVPNPSGGGQRLLSALEGPGIVYRLRPRETPVEQAAISLTEKNVRQSLIAQFGFPSPYLYLVVAYSDMPRIENKTLITLGVYHPLRGHENSAWYYVRDDYGQYQLREIQSLSEKSLIATRQITASPFPIETGKIFYVGGYDTNSRASHNTAWIYRVGKNTLLGR